MKLIDDKGRLFGKINVIDLLVILLLLGLIPIFYYGYKIATYKPEAPPLTLQEHTYREFEVIFSSIPKKFLPLLKVGDKQYKEKKIIAEIIKIINKKPIKIKLTMGQSDKAGYTFDMEDFFNLKVLLKLLVTPVKDGFVYQGTILKINSEISFSTDKYFIKGFIPPPPPQNPTEMTVTVQINNLMPQIAAIIKKGDQEILFGTNIQIAEITGIVKIENAKIIRFHDEVTRQYENPFYRDMTLEVSLVADQIKDTYFFKKKPIKIGTTIDFSNKRYSFTGTIINILK